MRAADDPASAVRLQAIYYLSLLGDPRADSVVKRVRVEVVANDLSATPSRVITRLWTVGPFDDGVRGLD
jgi:hypothetical protein